MVSLVGQADLYLSDIVTTLSQDPHVVEIIFPEETAVTPNVKYSAWKSQNMIRLKNQQITDFLNGVYISDDFEDHIARRKWRSGYEKSSMSGVFAELYNRNILKANALISFTGWGRIASDYLGPEEHKKQLGFLLRYAERLIDERNIVELRETLKDIQMAMLNASEAYARQPSVVKRQHVKEEPYSFTPVIRSYEL